MTRTLIKRLSIDNARPGMILGKPACREDGTVMLDEGHELTIGLLERLTSWGVRFLDVRETVSDADAPTAFIANYQPVVEQYQAFAETYRDVIDTVSHVFEDARYFRKVPLAKFRELTKCSIMDLMNAPNTLSFIHLIYNENSPGYQHSLSVSVLSGVLARWMGYSETETEDIILAGLLHDIGKTQLPPEIADNQALTDDEMEVMRTHPTLGYKLLSELESFPLSILSAVLQHHERMDGTGYPLGLRGNQIHPYAQVIAVADAYDALTSRTYLRRLTPFEAVAVLRTEMFEQLNPEICTVFLHNLRTYLIGQYVTLSDGRLAEVVFLGNDLVQLPVVRTMDGTFIDLAKDPSVYIADVPELGKIQS